MCQKINFPTNISIVDIIYSCLFSKMFTDHGKTYSSPIVPILFISGLQIEVAVLKKVTQESLIQRPNSNLPQLYISSGNFSRSHKRHIHDRQSNATDLILKKPCPTKSNVPSKYQILVLFCYTCYGPIN